jgi:tRNA 5-methylaminomethyl-2-thiouridine biosynthesis bifunctional protein
VSAEVAAELAGWPVAAPGWWFSFGGWLRPGRACEANLLAYPERIVRHFGRGVERLRRTAGGWSIEDAAGREICAAPRVILANANDAARVAPLSCIPLKAARGQITYLAEDARRRLHVPVCRRGYITPASGGFHCIGATFDRDQEPRARAADHAINLARLHATLPGFADSVDPERLAGRVAFRATTPDRLPVIGLLPPGDADRADPPDGIYLLTGLGARGLVWAPLAAELLASELETEPSPVEGALVRAVDPARFAARRRPVQRITNAS